MKMKMKSTLFFVPLMMMIMITIVQRTNATTTGRPAYNLNGVMATVSSRGGAISFYPPYYSPESSSPSYTTRRPYYTTTRRPYYTTTRPYTPTTRPHTTATRPHTTATRPHTTATRPHTTATTRPYTTATTRPYTTATTRPYTTATTRPYTTPTPPKTTTRRPTTTPPHYPTTTAPWTPTPPSTRGLSVCLRYLSDSGLYLTLSPQQGRDRVSLSAGYDQYYALTYGWSNTLRLNPSIKILPGVAPEIWTRVCVTLDFTKKVVQMFRDSNMSIRRRLFELYPWQGEPVIQFSDFTGQVTDIQMWDYPLNYREVTEYMNGGVYRLYRGTLLTWSYISYSNSGNLLLEDVYEVQAKLPLRGRGHRLRGGKKSSRLHFNVGESKRQQLK